MAHRFDDFAAGKCLYLLSASRKCDDEASVAVHRTRRRVKRVRWRDGQPRACGCGRIVFWVAIIGGRECGSRHSGDLGFPS